MGCHTCPYEPALGFGLQPCVSSWWPLMRVPLSAISLGLLKKLLLLLFASFLSMKPWRSCLNLVKPIQSICTTIWNCWHSTRKSDFCSWLPASSHKYCYCLRNMMTLVSIECALNRFMTRRPGLSEMNRNLSHLISFTSDSWVLVTASLPRTSF